MLNLEDYVIKNIILKWNHSQYNMKYNQKIILNYLLLILFMNHFNRKLLMNNNVKFALIILSILMILYNVIIVKNIIVILVMINYELLNVHFVDKILNYLFKKKYIMIQIIIHMILKLMKKKLNDYIILQLLELN